MTWGLVAVLGGKSGCDVRSGRGLVGDSCDVGGGSGCYSAIRW